MIHRIRIKDMPEDLMKSTIDSGFLYFSSFLSALDIRSQDAAEYFYDDYYSAILRTDDVMKIVGFFKEAAQTNKRKYQMLIEAYQAQFDPIENYNRVEASTKIRTPDLTSETSAETERKQTRTVTENGGTYQETDTRQSAPYNSSDFHNLEKNDRTYSGSRTTEEAYSGDPDSASSTTTTTGTDTETFRSNIHGNIGTVTSQQMLESSFALAEKMNIFRIIEKDIAAILLLQVWL